jgi:hypothetical protein
MPAVDHITTFFYLPLITIFPINSLGIETADLDFNVEITSQYYAGSQEEETAPESGFLTGKKTSSAELWGKISQGRPSSSEEKEWSYHRDRTSSLHINVEAGTLPLTRGLLEIINIYTNAIQVGDLKEEKQKILNH